MSRRLRHFRQFRGQTVQETYAAIVGSTQVARDENGAVVTRPIKPEKATRLAAALHRPKKVI